MRLNEVIEIDDYTVISIHAPAKGATVCFYYRFYKITYFNPRTREGCDSGILISSPAGSIFQSTHPRRVRLSMLNSCIRFTIISIHAPAKGATNGGYTILLLRDPFQSTHPRRVRPRLPAHLLLVLAFQSTHPRRVRPYRTCKV